MASMCTHKPRGTSVSLFDHFIGTDEQSGSLSPGASITAMTANR